MHGSLAYCYMKKKHSTQLGIYYCGELTGYNTYDLNKSSSCNGKGNIIVILVVLFLLYN